MAKRSIPKPATRKVSKARAKPKVPGPYWTVVHDDHAEDVRRYGNFYQYGYVYDGSGWQEFTQVHKGHFS